MNDYDKAGRYLVKRDAVGFFRWLLAAPRLSFRAWIDARRVALPKQGDLTNDLVAAVQSNGALEAICLELEAEARADALTRLLVYLARFWCEPADRDSLPVTSAGGVILDLTGRSNARELRVCPVSVPACRMEFSVLRCPLGDEDAGRLTASVKSGEISPWLLGWVPLMHGGADSAIIAEWLAAADRHLRDERDRADLGSLVLVLATLANCRPVWERGLRGWNMKTSPFLDEIRAEGRQEGRQEGRTEGAYSLLLRLGQEKFGKAPTKKQQKALKAITDLLRLEGLGERLLHVDSWAELLGER